MRTDNDNPKAQINMTINSLSWSLVTGDSLLICKELNAQRGGSNIGSLSGPS